MGTHITEQNKNTILSVLDNSDTPNNFIGKAAYHVVVNNAEDALEFVVASGSSGNFISLTDTPGSITPSALVVGNTDGADLQFSTVTASGGIFTIPDTTASIIMSAARATGSSENDFALDAANTFPAVSEGLQQRSPALRLIGQGWKTDATATSQSLAFQTQVRPTIGTSEPGGALWWSKAVAGGSITDVMSITTNSRLTLENTGGQFWSTSAYALGTDETNSSYGLLLENTTIAAAGAQQYSPAISLYGRGWKTDATPGSRSVSFQIQTQPVEGAALPTGNLVFSSDINGAGASTQLTLTSDGSLITSGDLTVGGSLTQYAGLSVVSNASATTVSVAGTFYQFTGFDTDMPNRDAVPANASDDITINTAGDYLITWQASLITAGDNVVIAVQIEKNNGATTVGAKATRKVATGSDVDSMSGTVIATLAASDTLELWLTNETSATTVTLEDVEFTAVRIG